MSKSKLSFSRKKKPRKPVVAGTKKDEVAFKAQYTRTQVLNVLASAVNLILHRYVKRLKPGSFYSSVQSRFRRESSNERVLLLNELDGMEINEQYRFGNLCRLPIIGLKKTSDAIEIKLAVDQHPDTREKDCNCYYLEVVLAVWSRGNTYEHSSKKTCWINPEKERPHFTFSFAKPAYANEYMICLRVSLGYQNNKELDMMVSQGTMIWQTGSFTKTGKALLAEKIKRKKDEPKSNSIIMPKQQEERVMPDGYI